MSATLYRSLEDAIRIALTRSKVGRRAVHHILSSSERKAYEIAKRSAHLVRSAGARKQPLADTYYKYCEALKWPYIFIHREHARDKDNRVAIDLRTLGLSDCMIEELSSKVVATLLPLDTNCLPHNLRAASEIFAASTPIENESDEKLLNFSNDVQAIPKLKGLLRFQGTFGDAKRMSELSLNICQLFLMDNGIELVKPWWTVK